MKIKVWVVFRRKDGKPRVVEYYNNLPSSSLSQWLWQTNTENRYGIAEVQVGLFRSFRANLGQYVTDNWDRLAPSILTEGGRST